jgi:hypothetical protein
MTETKRKRLYWLFKILGVVVSCTLPIWAIVEKYPVWNTNYGKAQSIGVGGILALFVMLIVFRRSVFNFMRDRLKLKHAPPLAVWIVMLIIAYALLYINRFIQDMITVCWLGFVGCAIGTLFTFIAENRFGRESESK